MSKRMSLMDGQTKLDGAKFRNHARGQFVEQMGGGGHHFMQIGLMRSAALQYQMLNMLKNPNKKPKTAEEHAIMCALRVWSYFNPGYPWSQQAPCGKCGNIISSLDDISIVTMALPIWDGGSF